MLNPFALSFVAVLLLAPGVPPPVEDAPVAAHATITGVEAAVETGADCVRASGDIAATYAGDRYPIWEYRTPWRWCDGTNMLRDPIGIETVWTGHPDVDTPIRVRVDLDVGPSRAPVPSRTQAFWFYPYGPDGDCVTKVKRSPVASGFAVDVEIEFCS